MSVAGADGRKQGQFLRRLELIRPYRARLALGMVMLLITVGIQLSYPGAIAFFIDSSIGQQGTGWLGLIAIVMGMAVLIQAAATALRHYIFSSTGSMIITGLRKKLYGVIVRQEIGFFDRQNIGDLTNRLSSDVEQLQNVLTMQLAILLQAVLTGTGAAVMLMIISPQLSILILALAPLVVLSARWMGVQTRKNARLRQEKLASCTHIAQETFSNIRLVHAFTQEAHEQKRYGRAADAALRFSMSCNRLFAGFQGLGALVQSMALLLTLWFGGQLVAGQTISIGELTGFVLYAGMAAGSASTVSAMWGEWMKSIGATERVFELLDRRPEIRTGSPTCAVTPTAQNLVTGRARGGSISFQSVSFSYPARPRHPALESIDLQIEAGEKIALVGPSGAGKTTIVNLLLGFYVPDRGVIRLDGIDTRKLKLADIRRSMAIVEQEPALFSGTIIENLRYGALTADVPDEEVMKAATSANVHDFVSGFPQGYQTPVGNRGVQLSGGQKQRIAIARALLRDPKILILDEATSALDSENESKVQSALQRLMEGRTTIMIAHRLSTISYADRLIVMRDGRIVQSGTHDELMQNREAFYYRLMKDQLLQHRLSLKGNVRTDTAGRRIGAANIISEGGGPG